MVGATALRAVTCDEQIGFGGAKAVVEEARRAMMRAEMRAIVLYDNMIILLSIVAKL